MNDRHEVKFCGLTRKDIVPVLLIALIAIGSLAYAGHIQKKEQATCAMNHCL